MLFYTLGKNVYRYIHNSDASSKIKKNYTEIMSKMFSPKHLQIIFVSSEFENKRCFMIHKLLVCDSNCLCVY